MISVSPTGPVSHEQKLSQSLEIALSSTLGSMPSFTARLSKGQLQQLGTRGSSTARRPDTSYGKSSVRPSVCLWSMLGLVSVCCGSA